MPVARGVLGESHELTLKVNWIYAMTLCQDPGATLKNLRESVEMHEDLERTARRVFGSAYPFVRVMEASLQEARAALHAREASTGSV